MALPSKQNIMKGATIYPSINFSSPSNSSNVTGETYNAVRGSFLISTYTPAVVIGQQLGLVGTNLSESSNCFSFPDYDYDSKRGFKTLNIQLTQVSYSDIDTAGTPNFTSRFAEITTSAVLNQTTGIWTTSSNETPSTNSPANLGDDPFPLSYNSCVYYDVDRFKFKIVRSSGSTARLQQFIKGIYTLY